MEVEEGEGFVFVVDVGFGVCSCFCFGCGCCSVVPGKRNVESAVKFLGEFAVEGVPGVGFGVFVIGYYNC